jgi:hypothetical protein
MSLTATELTQCRAQLGESDAKWVSQAWDDALGRLTVTRRWKVGHDRIRAAAEYLETFGYTTGTGEGALTTITNPKSGDETFAGTFRAVRVWDGANDGQVDWIYQTLRRVQSPATAAALAALTKIRTQEEEIVRPFGFTSGTRWDAAFIWYDINPSQKTALETLEGSALASAVAGSGWTYADRKWQDGEDNVGAFVLLVKKVLWENRWAANAEKKIDGAITISEQNPNDTDGEKSATLEATGISDGTVDADYADAKKANLGATTGWGTGLYVVDAASKSEAADGERVVRAVRSDVTGLVSAEKMSTDALTIELTPEIGKHSATATRRWKRVSKAYKDALIANSGIARTAFTVPETGNTYSHTGVSITDHGNQVYTVTQNGQIIDYSQWDTHVDTRGRAVYRKVASSDTDPNPALYVKWPIYRQDHVFRATWSECFTACKNKRGAVKTENPVGQYPIIGSIQVGGFNEWIYHGTVTTFRGWWPSGSWKLATEEEYEGIDA